MVLSSGLYVFSYHEGELECVCVLTRLHPYPVASCRKPLLLMRFGSLLFLNEPPPPPPSTFTTTTDVTVPNTHLKHGFG